MTTLTKTYPTEVAARRAVKALRATGVAERDIRLLVGSATRDIRQEPVGGFAGPVAPDAPIGTYGGRVLQRRQGSGSFAGDPDQQRQGSFADTDRVVIVTYKGDAERARADHRPSRSPAAPAPGRTRRRRRRPGGGRAAPRTRDPPRRPPRDRRKGSGCAARETRARRLSACGVPRPQPSI